MKHVTVYAEEGMFAGWPANHGAWQRGDEFLVGFMRGTYGIGSFHEITEPFDKVQARSLDGGETWKLEKPNVDFECRDSLLLLTPPRFDIKHCIIRAVGCYDTGGDHTCRQGGFYLSSNFGRRWEGPFAFSGLETAFHDLCLNTSRTRVLDDTIYLSARHKEQWGTDWVFSAYHNGSTFDYRELILHDKCRAVMPDVVNLGDTRVCVMRRKGHGQNWIDCFASINNGPWIQTSAEGVANTGFANGNPPALAEVDGTLFCAYGERSIKHLCVRASDDGGMTWPKMIVLGQSSNRDLGYPQLFKRSDGKLVCVYYISTDICKPASINATIFSPQEVL